MIDLKWVNICPKLIAITTCKEKTLTKIIICYVMQEFKLEIFQFGDTGSAKWSQRIIWHQIDPGDLMRNLRHVKDT